MNFREKFTIAVQMTILCGIIGSLVFGIITRPPSPEEQKIAQLSEALDKAIEENPKIKQLQDALQEAIDDNEEPPDRPSYYGN